MASGSLGTGSMKLGVNAEGLYSGLKAAATKTKDTATGMAKSFGGGAGGIFGGLIGGLASAGKWLGKGGLLAVGFIGVTAAVEGVKFAIEGISKGIEHVIGKATEFRDKIRDGSLRVDQNQTTDLQQTPTPGVNSVSTDIAKGINTAAVAIEKVQSLFDRVTAKIIKEFAPVFNLVADAIEEWVPKLSPVIEWLGKGLGTVTSIGIELFNSFVDGIGTVVDAVSGWIGKTFELTDAWPTFQDVVLGVLKGVGKAGAYVWDTFKAGIGAVSVAVGLLIRGFGKLVDAFQVVVSLAKSLPDSLKPAGLDAFIAGVERVGGTIGETGREIQQWGEEAIAEFGNSAAAVEEFIDGIATRAADRRARAARDAGEIQSKFDPEKAKAGAVQAGSTAFAEISARFRTEGLFNPALQVQRDQLAEQRKNTAAVNEVRDAVRDLSFADFSIL